MMRCTTRPISVLSCTKVKLYNSVINLPLARTNLEQTGISEHYHTGISEHYLNIIPPVTPLSFGANVAISSQEQT